MADGQQPVRTVVQWAVSRAVTVLPDRRHAARKTIIAPGLRALLILHPDISRMVLTFRALRSEPAELAEALLLRVSGRLEIHAATVAAAILVLGAFVPVLAFMARVQRVAPAPAGDVLAVTGARLAVFRSFNARASHKQRLSIRFGCLLGMMSTSAQLQNV